MKGVATASSSKLQILLVIVVGTLPYILTKVIFYYQFSRNVVLKNSNSIQDNREDESELDESSVNSSAIDVVDRDQEMVRLKEEITIAERCLYEVKTYHQEEMIKLVKQISYMEKKVIELDLWCQSLDEDFRKVKTGNSDLEADIEKLQIIVYKKNDQLNEIIQDYNMLMDENDRLNARVEELIAEMRSKDDHLNAMHLERVKMAGEMAQAGEMVEKLRSRVEELEEKVVKQQELILEGEEAKREVIRQLSFSIEHYRIRYQEIREAILSHRISSTLELKFK